MAAQQILEVSTRGRSTTEITAEVAQIVRTAQVATGLANVFVGSSQKTENKAR